MNKQEYLLGCLAEECVEVAKECLKANRFGLDDQYEDMPPIREKIFNELADLTAVVELAEAYGIFNLDKEPDFDNLVRAKKEKIAKFMQYSKEKGTLTE